MSDEAYKDMLAVEPKKAAKVNDRYRKAASRKKDFIKACELEGLVSYPTTSVIFSLYFLSLQTGVMPKCSNVTF